MYITNNLIFKKSKVLHYDSIRNLFSIRYTEKSNDSSIHQALQEF